MDVSKFPIKKDPDEDSAKNQTMCLTCLSTNRRVRKLGRFKDIFSHLLRFESLDDVQETAWFESVWLCWECIALLRRVIQFHARALQAGDMLEMARSYGVDFKLESLTTLDICKIDTTISVEHVEKELFPLKTESQEIEVKVDMETFDHYSDSLKSEYDEESLTLKDFKTNLSEYQNKISALNLNLVKPEYSKRKPTKSKKQKHEEQQQKHVERQRKHVDRQRKHVKREKKLKTEKLEKKRRQISFKERTFLNTFVCDICNKCYKYKPYLKDHLLAKHGFDRPRKCSKCDKVLPDTRKLKYHMTTQHRNPEYETVDRRYCVECDKTFNSVFLYKTHCYNMHGPLGSYKKSLQKLPCPDCGKMFANALNMQNHYKLIHERKTDHYCPEHDKYFYSKWKLREHISAIHNGMPLHKNKICQHCGRAFSDQTVLANHIRTHTGEKPFACPHCTSAFSQKSAMTHHVRHVHALKTAQTGKLGKCTQNEYFNDSSLIKFKLESGRS